jgi:hypothetical protein
MLMEEECQKLPRNWCVSPRNRRGLGIINLEVQNQALLMRNLDKFHNRKDIPWVNMV